MNPTPSESEIREHGSLLDELYGPPHLQLWSYSNHLYELGPSWVSDLGPLHRLTPNHPELFREISTPAP